jgi:phosphoribosylaminoimidazole-succinocarboxamide synthase
MNLRHETFIREMIAHGNRRHAYLAAYPLSSPKAAYNNACRLLAIPYIYNRIYSVVVQTEQQAITQLQQQTGASLAEKFEKRVVLARIIKTAIGKQEYPDLETSLFQIETSGQVKRNKRETKRNKKEIRPTVSQVLRAIVLDTKLEFGWKRKL